MRDSWKENEFAVAKFVNWLGKIVGKSMYMEVWAQKPA
jgi:hypothetical protein